MKIMVKKTTITCHDCNRGRNRGTAFLMLYFRTRQDGQHHTIANPSLAKNPRTHCPRGWLAPRAGLDVCGETPLPSPGL